MKKLKLTALNLGAKEILTRTQLKSILGGLDGSGGTGSGGCSSSPSSSCCVDCKDGGKTKDCGYGVICSTSGTQIKCGSGAYEEMCV